MNLVIREHNRGAHLDIEQDIQTKKNGLFTFVLRVNGGNIVDYTVMEQESGQRYNNLLRVVIQKLAIAYHN